MNDAPPPQATGPRLISGRSGYRIDWAEEAGRLLGRPVDEWLIEHALAGHGARWMAKQLEDETGLRISRESIRKRKAALRASLDESKAS